MSRPFPWRRGMTAIDERGERWLIVENDGKNWAQCRPDPDDGATKGALLDAVRERLGRPDLFLLPLWSIETGQLMAWSACLQGEQGWRGATELDALLAAWEAAP